MWKVFGGCGWEPLGVCLGGSGYQCVGANAFPTVKSGEDYVNVPESEESADASLGERLGSAFPPHSRAPHPILTLIPALRVPTAPSLALSPSAWVSSSSLTLSVACPPFGMAVPPSDLSPQMGAGSM